ncbi:MAG: hypothetical protein LH702_17270, partial [Phormidesmis sp. CAN_BIN44]|nr:hypothetical protein [Phormidesmis sp. CAN_BIN44]
LDAATAFQQAISEGENRLSAQALAQTGQRKPSDLRRDLSSQEPGEESQFGEVCVIPHLLLR